ncbi:DNA-binding response regulator [Opitutaceae bacterium EW11]|nr:DNA-binding response regulator [Opitutaceae bacterium EW11]
MKRARIVLADDHRILLDGLKTVLSEEFDLVGTAMSGTELVQLARRLRPDAVVTDIGMPEVSGVDATRLLLREGLPAKFVVLTMRGDLNAVLEAFRAGASGYVIKNAAGTELVLAVREALAGRVFISPYVANDLIRVLLSSPTLRDQLPAAAPFTRRQAEVLRLVAQGKTMKEVAACLGISTRTAEVHKYQMMDRLHVRTVPELIRCGIRAGIVEISGGPVDSVPAPVALAN